MAFLLSFKPAEAKEQEFVNLSEEGMLLENVNIEKLMKLEQFGVHPART